MHCGTERNETKSNPKVKQALLRQVDCLFLYDQMTIWLRAAFVVSALVVHLILTLFRMSQMEYR